MFTRFLIWLWFVVVYGSSCAMGDDYLLSLYKHLHQNPELSFQEQKTAARIARELIDIGYEVTTGVGGYGLVGVLKNGPGSTLLLRTDLDALPINEQTGLAYASQIKAIEQTGQEVSVMHACGHDIHMTVLVGAARWLAKNTDQWSGTLVMIGQPAEERGAGARLMLKDGLFTKFPRPDYNLALHVSSEMPAGTVGYVPGWATANVDSVDIRVRGIGGHGAYPHSTKDPIVLASSIIMNLQTLVSREISPTEPAVVTVGSIHGGAKHNIIPDQVDLQLTVRSFSDKVRKKLLAGIERIAKVQARVFGFPEDKLPVVSVKDEYTPSAWNDPQLAAKLAQAFSDKLGEDNVFKLKPTMGGEDFARYGRQTPKIPSLLFSLGAVDPAQYKRARVNKHALPSIHSPFFAPSAEPTIGTGVKVMVQAALTLLSVEH
jgi:amidohydrolase